MPQKDRRADKAQAEAIVFTDLAALRGIPHLPAADTRHSSSLERGLRIMGLFTEDRPTWRLADVAAELGYSRSTTHRYLTTLVTLGQLVQTTARRYRHPQFSASAAAFD
jgi:AraC-like DNA-binding protein